MLSNLQLKNFKRHEALDLVFEEELNTLTGENASGKSSILKAILYSLFGVAAAGAKDHLWKWGAEGKRSVALAITLPDYGRVAVTRTVTGATILTEDGRVLASGQTAVTKFIEDALGMAVKDLRTLCYSPQGETQGLLSMGPAVLQQKVESLSRADVVDNVLTKIGSDIAKYDGKLEGLLVDLGLEEITTKIADLDGFIFYKNEELSGVIPQEVSLQRTKTALVVKGRTAQEELSKWKLLTNSLASLNLTAEEIQQEISREKALLTDNAEAMTRESKERHAISLKLAALLAEKTTKIRAATTAAATRKALEEDIASYTSTLVVCERRIAENTQVKWVVEKEETALAALSADLSETEKSLAGYKEMLHKGVCPTCKQLTAEIDVAYCTAQAQELQEKLATLQESKRAMSSKLVELSKTLQPLPMDYDKCRILLTDRSTSLAALPETDPLELSMWVNDRAELVKESEDNEVRLANLTKLLNRDAIISKGIDTNQQQYQAILSKIDALQAELAPLLDNSEQIEAITLELKQVDAELDQVGRRRSSLEAEVAVGKERLVIAKKELERVKAVLKEKEDTLKVKSDTESLQKFLRKNRAAFAGDIWQDLLSYASSLVASTTEGRLSGLSRSTRGEFTVEEWDKTIPVTEASGAQKSIIGLAVRAAMAKTFYGKGLFLLLDEVSSDASDANAAAIAGMLKGLDMQVISVTHRQGEASNAGTIINLD